MVTIEQIQKAFGDDRTPFKTKNVDHDFVAISLLRERIPYERCKNILTCAAHDVVYLCDADVACEFLSPEDLEVLGDCNVFYEEDFGCLGLFV